MSAARELITTLDAQGDSQDALARRAIDELATLSSDIKAIDDLQRLAVDMALARSSFVAEAAGILRHATITQPHRRRLFEAMFPGADLSKELH